MVKKFLLEIQPEPSIYSLLGISCHLMDYRLSYLINQQLEFNLEKRDDLVTRSYKTKSESKFSFYLFNDEENYCRYVLLANRSQEFVLIQEIKQVDFLLIIDGEIKKSRIDQLIKNVKKIPNVLTSFEVNPESIKNGSMLFSDIEMHLTYLSRVEKLFSSPLLRNSPPVAKVS